MEGDKGDIKSSTVSPSPVQPIPALPKRPSVKKPIILAVVIVVAVLIGAGALILFNRRSLSVSQNINNTSKPTLQPTPTQSAQNIYGDVLSGKLQRLNENLGLLLSGFPNNQIDPNITYYKAGTYTTGSFAGYTRYIAIGEENSSGSPVVTFASKDQQTYIIDANPADFSDIGSNNISWPLSLVNKSKITAAQYLPSEQPDLIPLDSHFVLWKDSVATVIPELTKQNYLDSKAALVTLQTDFSTNPTLKSPISYLTMYQNSVSDNSALPYIAGTTAVYVVDSTGLAYKYILANSPTANPYAKQLDTYNQQLNDFQHRKNIPLPSYPAKPNLRMDSTDISTNALLYNSYDIALPHACAFNGDTLVGKNISDADLQKIGTSIDGDVYVLKDQNHPLNKAEYYNKITLVIDPTQSGNQTNSEFGAVNSGQTPPTYDQYVQKNPLLFVKDYWGRWVMLGEFDYHLMGGCGKPVVYLYPPKPTKVSIQFLKPITFDIDIPKYHFGWNVLAQPNGTLTDLQPQLTDCSKIDSQRFGSGYALQACQNNSYPYLYWAGTSTDAVYPDISKGWIVKNSNLSTFMETTLNTIGFNPQEKADFLSYWLPQMQVYNAPYYRISFLQNAEMDEIAPMRITPVPDHYYRYFLDFLPLKTKPSNTIEPESLTKIVRRGFTLVEWGGNLQPSSY